jgi:hypothetical protein
MELEDDRQIRLSARSKLEQWRIQHSLKFSIGIFFILLLYFILYYIFGVQRQGFTKLPLLCVGVGAAFHGVCLMFQIYQIRRFWTRRYDISGWALSVTLIVDAALIALTRFDVKIVLYNAYPGMEDYLGGDPMNWEGKIGNMSKCQLADIKQDLNITTQSFQFLLLYFILFVLSARQSCVVGAFGPMVYCFVATVFGTSKLIPHLSIGEVGFQMDNLVMLMSVAFMVLAKVLIEGSKLKLFEVLETQREQIVTEKVLRCEAEFAKEKVLSTTGELDDASRNHRKWDQWDNGFDMKSLAASHAESAPAILAPLVPKAEDSCIEGSGDCLPTNAMVWTENAKPPQLLRSLAPGARILCYDILSKSLAYATIERLEESVNTEWVKLSMEDGSLLEVTKDHPVSVQAGDGAILSQGCIRAGELKAGRDRLLMLKMVWVPVSDVRHVSSGYSKGAETADGIPSAEPLVPSSITISVEQRERYEIFVTTGDKNGKPGPPIAVGSSDRSTDLFGKLRNKNTFLHYQTGSPALKRSNSDPGFAGSGSVFSLRSTAPPETDKKGSSTAGMSTTESCCTSSISKASTEGDCIVKVGRAPFNDSTTNVASLTAVAGLKSNGIPSFGSDHASYMCRSPCSFQFAGLVTPGRWGCTAGALCEYCHDTQHQPYLSSKLRKLSRLPPHLAKTKGRQIVQM